MVKIVRMISRFPYSLSLVIPLFNNEKTLVSQINTSLVILDRLTSDYELIVCDDKSTDNSASLLKKNFSRNSHVRLIYHPVNWGIAKTIFHLYTQAKKEYILLYSVDGDWDTDDINKFITTTHKTDADIVLGKRDKSVYSLYRKVISGSYNLFARLLFGVNTVDAGSIKLFKRSLFSGSVIISRSMFFEAEMIIRAIRSGHKLKIIPVRFYKQKGDAGRGAKAGSVIESLLDALRLRLIGI